MAGHNHSLHIDPALGKYNDLYVNRHKFFRFSPRTAWITFAYVVLVPGIIGTIAYKYEGKYEMRGKRRGDTIVEW